MNRCNELIDWRCLRDRHRYTPQTRLHVRWLSAQRRPASLSIGRPTRRGASPAAPVRVPRSRTPPFVLLSSLLSGRKSDKCADLSACQICSALHAASLFSRSTLVLRPPPPAVPPADSRGQNSLSAELVVGGCFFIAGYIFARPESRRQAAALIHLPRFHATRIKRVVWQCAERRARPVLIARSQLDRIAVTIDVVK